MKKILLLTISILTLTVVIAKAGNPIPSFNVPVNNQAVFTEDPSGDNNPPLYEKRDMNVQNGTAGSHRPIGHGNGTISVYVYRVDHSITLGPFTIPYGESIDVKIDGGRWGVSTITGFRDVVSVWTSDVKHQR